MVSIMLASWVLHPLPSIGQLGCSGDHFTKVLSTHNSTLVKDFVALMQWIIIRLWHTFYNYAIISQFCTCHDSWAVVTCAKLLYDWIIEFKIKAKRIFKRFQLWVVNKGLPIWISPVMLPIDKHMARKPTNYPPTVSLSTTSSRILRISNL